MLFKQIDQSVGSISHKHDLHYSSILLYGFYTTLLKIHFHAPSKEFIETIYENITLVIGN